MSQPTLFPLPSSLSPRLKWMETHGAVTYRCASDGLWLAAIPSRHGWKYSCIADFFAQETAHNETTNLGSGINEEEALEGLCVIYELPHWSEDSH